MTTAPNVLGDNGHAPTGLPTLSMSTSNPGGTVTISNGYGATFTLDPVSREIVSNDGKVLYLTTEQAADAATAFRAILHGDSLAAIVMGECSRSFEPELCEEPTFAPPSAPSVLGSGGAAPATTPGGLIFRSVAAGMAPATMNLSGTSTLVTWPPSCLDISRALYQSKDQFMAPRALFVSLLTSLFQNTVGLDPYGRPQVEPPSPLEAATMSVTALDNQAKLVGMAQLGALYKMYDCFDRDWQDAAAPRNPFPTGGSTPPSPGEPELVCAWEELLVSNDDGMTWFSTGITWENCRYVYAE